jgi:hypothetical protein
MARSRRKPYRKVRSWRKHQYWKVIRREWKQQLHKNWDDEDLHLRLPQEIINDCDYYDRWFIVTEDSEGLLRHYGGTGWTKEDVEKYSRK